MGGLAGFGDFQKLEDIGLAQQVGGLFDELALGGKAQKQRAFFLPDQLAH